jgi:hypothetical protein
MGYHVLPWMMCAGVLSVPVLIGSELRMRMEGLELLECLNPAALRSARLPSALGVSVWSMAHCWLDG